MNEKLIQIKIFPHLTIMLQKDKIKQGEKDIKKWVNLFFYSQKCIPDSNKKKIFRPIYKSAYQIHTNNLTAINN